jgi:hypothetical protein
MHMLLRTTISHHYRHQQHGTAQKPKNMQFAAHSDAVIRYRALNHQIELAEKK